MPKRNHVEPLATNKHLLKWVEKIANLTKPAAIHWVDGSQEEYDVLCAQLVKAGTFTPSGMDSGRITRSVGVGGRGVNVGRSRGVGAAPA